MGPGEILLHSLAFQFLIEKPEGEKPLRALRCEENIKIELKPVEDEGMDLFQLDQGRDNQRSSVSAVTNLRANKKDKRFLKELSRLCSVELCLQ